MLNNGCRFILAARISGSRLRGRLVFGTIDFISCGGCRSGGRDCRFVQHADSEVYGRRKLSIIMPKRSGKGDCTRCATRGRKADCGTGLGATVSALVPRIGSFSRLLHHLRRVKCRVGRNGCVSFHTTKRRQFAHAGALNTTCARRTVGRHVGNICITGAGALQRSGGVQLIISLRGDVGTRRSTNCRQ